MSSLRPTRGLAVPIAALALAACNETTKAPVAPNPESQPNAAVAAPAGGVLPTLAAKPPAGASFDRINAMDVAVAPRAAGAAVTIAGAAPGTLVRQINGANPCPIQTGIGFDGTSLIMSCWYNQTLDFLSPADGHLVRQLRVPSLSGGFFAMGWDGRDNRLWICSASQQVYRIDTSDPNGDGIVDPGEVQFRFTASDQCTDGFSFDGADRTVWTSGDVHPNVYHYTENGALLGIHYVAGILGTGNSGIAAGGGKLYLANNGRSQIYVTNKPPTSGSLFATFPRRIEDLECDDITFRNDGIAVIWQQDAYDREIRAYAIEPGACPFGGFAVTQVVMDVQPNRISLTGNPVVNVILLSNGIFDATAVNLANVKFVVNGDVAHGAPVAKRGAAYVTSTADYNHDGRLDRMVVFNMAALRTAGLVAGSTNYSVQDATGPSGMFEAKDTVVPTIVP